MELFNAHFGLALAYEAMSVEDYRRERTAELGDFMANIITGIYDGIRQGAANLDSDYQHAAGRPHVAWEQYFREAAARRGN